MRFTFQEKHFRVDLVFYNRIFRCFVLVDLKTGELTHGDVGQMMMYVNYHDRKVKMADENQQAFRCSGGAGSRERASREGVEVGGARS